MSQSPLLIGAIADYKILQPHGFHMAGDKYLRAISQAMDALPVIIPALAEEIDSAALLARLDGLLLTGGYSNIAPHHYEEKNIETKPLRDPQRDSASFALIKAALKSKLPVLGICRGFQEINVALGGSLHQQVQAQSGLQDHREDKTVHLEKQYSPSHTIRLNEEGWLRGCSEALDVEVNSLHAQGVKTLANGLAIEAQAEDGLIEAYSSVDKTHFLLAVQWHPEWRVMENPFYHCIFKLFKSACHKYRKNHLLTRTELA